MNQADKQRAQAMQGTLLHEQAGKQRIESIQETLLHEMKRGAYRYAERLPRESALAQRLGISRTQLRDSLAELEREGFITRRHGVGTVINRHVLSVPVRADLEAEFMEMVVQSGFAPEERLLAARRVPAGKAEAARLGIAAGEEALFVSRLVTANGRPAVYCEDYIPCSLIRDFSYTDADLQAPIFDFLARFCSVEPYMDLTELRAVPARGEAARALGVALGEPLLYMDEVDYDMGGRPVLYAPQYFADGIIRHTVMRKKF